MPDRMPENMSEYMPEEMSDRMPEDMSEDMPDRMPEDLPEDMPDRMPEDLPVRKYINVMVGITRSKVILCSVMIVTFCKSISSTLTFSLQQTSHLGSHHIRDLGVLMIHLAP